MLIQTPHGNISIKEWQIASDLKRETCPHCQQTDCCYDCDASIVDLQSIQSERLGNKSDVAGRLQYNGALDGIESLLLALIPKMLETRPGAELWLETVVAEAVQTAVESCGNNL